MTTVVKEARYILTSIENNNNKFWNILLYDDNTCETQWGRIGENGQRKKAPGCGEDFFASRCRDKEAGGYKPLKTLGHVAGARQMEADRLASVAQRQIDTNSPETLALVTYLAKVNIHNILQATTLQYDTSLGTFTTPLGVVTAEGIAEARALLTQIGAFVYSQDYANPLFLKALNDYLMLVPQNIGRSRPDPKILYPNLQAVQAQNSILDALEASLRHILSAPKGAAPLPEPKMFEARLHLLQNGREIDRIRAKYRATQQAMHACYHLDVKRVFSVEIGSMQREFEQFGRNVGNVQELWHGTKASNLLSILKKGMYIPPSNAPHVTGRMFGNGTYFSDQSTKALNYSFGHWDGKREDNCFMFLCDVAMGRSFVPNAPSSNLPAPGFDSTFAQAGRSSVANNEMIVYKTSQIAPKYLIEFSPRGN